MEPDEKTVWDNKYKEALQSSLEPEPFLLDAFREFLAGRPPGMALDVAGGRGRHSLWLARQGWRVKLVDISEVGVALARENATRSLSPGRGESARREPLFEAEVLDLNRGPDLGYQQYDLVLVFFYLQRRLFPALIRALRPGGLLLYETYIRDQRRIGGPSNPEYLLEPNELLQAFQSMRILHYQEGTAGRAVAELVAQKPESG
jgi:SAM-dependent methyltransferase